MFKKAFTLSEILIALLVVAIIATILLRNLKMDNFNEKANTLRAYKAISAIEEASVKIREMEKTSCPTGAFMENVTGVQTYTLRNSAGSAVANSADIVALYAKYIKFETASLKFCDYTSYCSNDAIKGAKLSGNIYIGFMNDASIADCPSYYMPNNTTAIPAPSTINARSATFETAKCWGKAYIDTNGLDGPNALGKDVYVFGMNGVGLVK